jgi:transglutaminase-like putative cysteine protease
MATLQAKLALLIVAALFSSAPAAHHAKALDEWKDFAQSETLDVFLKDRLVGTLLHSFAAVDSGMRVESSMSVRNTPSAGSAKGSSIDLFEQRLYDADGALCGAQQTLKGESGTNEWKLARSGKGWILTIVAGGIASSVPIASVRENILPTLKIYKSIRSSKCRAGAVYADTAFELVSQKNIATTYRCTAVSADRKRITFDMIDDMAGRSQQWVLDNEARTLSQDIEGVFVARSTRSASAARKGDPGVLPPEAPQSAPVALSELADLFSVKKERPAQSGERISVTLPTGMSLDSSVSQFYQKRGDRLLCADFEDRCVAPSVSTSGADTLFARSAWTRPTPTIQSDYPAIVALAGKLSAGRKDRCSIIDTCNKYVYRRLAKRNTATFSNAVETLKAGFGDCGEHAVLLAALLRAAGIPARVILGLLYYPPKKAFVGHAWVMACNDGGQWIFCDPAFGIFPASRDRVPLIIDDNGAHALLLAKFIDRLGIDYVQR